LKEQLPAWHGTDSGYSNHGCRCQACTKAHADAQRAWDRRRALDRDVRKIVDRAGNLRPEHFELLRGLLPPVESDHRASA
jgi:hypothetical protein